MIKDLIILIIGLVGGVVYKLCVPAMFLLIACKLWYAPYTWSWLATITVPLVCGVCGLFTALIVKEIEEC